MTSPTSPVPNAAVAKSALDRSDLSRPDAPRAMGSGQMFDSIAHRYDLLNRILSLGLDRLWRRRTVKALVLEQGHRVLDLATGTGDLALDIVRRHPRVSVVGLDPSVRMLERAGEKSKKREAVAGRVEWVVGDAQQLEYAEGSFTAACMAFGIRNVPDRAKALREISRVLEPGGHCAILELSEPRRGLVSRLSRFYIHHLVPRLGALLSGASEYRYLQKSIAAFPAAEDFAQLMRDNGFDEVSLYPLTFGVVHLYVGRATAGTADVPSRAEDLR